MLNPLNEPDSDYQGTGSPYMQVVGKQVNWFTNYSDFVAERYQ